MVQLRKKISQLLKGGDLSPAGDNQFDDLQHSQPIRGATEEGGNRVRPFHGIPIFKWTLLVSCFIIVLAGLHFLSTRTSRENQESEEEQENEGFDQPDKFLEYFKAITTRDDGSTYPANHQYSELKKAQIALTNLKKASVRLNWVERGPGNIGGRTRGLILDPSDNGGNTWYAGSAGGGIWKTTDAGRSWRNLTPGLPNLSTVTLEMAASDNNVIYAGTGELQAGGTGLIKGSGIFKSHDRGETWTQLTSTVNNNFSYIHKIIVDPNNDNILLVSTNNGIFKSVNGGDSWKNVFYDGGLAQCLIPDPSDFSLIYASIRRNGIIRSVDRGETWKYIFRNSDGRIEMDISARNPSQMYALTDSSKLWFSGDKGLTWQACVPSGDPAQAKFLGSQGWWNNTIRIHPFNDQKVFIGGIDLFQAEITGTAGNVTTYSVDTLNTGTFLDFIDFTSDKIRYLKGITLETDKPDFALFEIRFGPNHRQKAHRFLVPEGSTSGVPDNQYTYQDYVEVPFEVWNTETNQQLMVSFRDQDRNGVFNLTLLDDNLKTGREYIYIHSIPYSDTPSDLVRVAGGQKVQNIAYIWPVLAAGGTWNPLKIPESSLRVTRSVSTSLAFNYTRLTRWSDPRTSSTYLHADIHNIQTTTRTGTPFKMVVASDGGVGYSEDGGISWINPLRGYNTAQFYGIDRHPTQDQYIGGMQDNGSWYSGNNPTVTSDWFNARGADGFEAVWHSQNPAKMITSIYYNQLYRSQNGGYNWSSITSTGSKNVGDTKAPFVTRIGNSPAYPDRIFIAGSSGVSRSVNFGQSWQDTDIPSLWNYSGIVQIAVSDANPDVVWAGCKMSSGSRVFVSTDGGTTFKATNGYQLPLGTLSGLVTHPSRPSTAFALFSFAGTPKILRTDNLGESWYDISGYSGTPAGFPDVAVYSLLVTDTISEKIWAGTEIGLFVTDDKGKSWYYADNGLPAASIWKLRMKGNQVIAATHGRGVWSVNLDEVLSSGEQPRLQAGDEGFTVYPNPCTDYINIRFSAASEGKAGFRIMTMEGKTVVQEQLTMNGTNLARISLPPLPSGNYILEISQKSAVRSKLIMVRK